MEQVNWGDNVKIVPPKVWTTYIEEYDTIEIERCIYDIHCNFATDNRPPFNIRPYCVVVSVSPAKIEGYFNVKKQSEIAVEAYVFNNNSDMGNWVKQFGYNNIYEKRYV